MMASTTTHSSTATSSASSNASCVTAVPGKYGRVPSTACNSNYAYDPNYGLAIFMSIVFCTLAAVHIAQAARYKKSFCWTLIMCVLWLAGAAIARALGSRNQQNVSIATASQLLTLLAPIWLNAFIYMCMGRMIYYFLPEKKIFFKATSLATWFVWFDILSFLVQATGGVLLSPGASASQIMNGIHIYMGGIGLQEFFILIFVGLSITFHRRMRMLEARGGQNLRPGWEKLTWTVYAVLVLITIRIIYRLIEYSSGTEPSNPLPNHEVYGFCLDTLPMSLAIILLSVIHPGRILLGPESHFPTRKVLRAQKTELKAQKKEEKRMQKEAKKNGGSLGSINIAMPSQDDSPRRYNDTYQSRNTYPPQGAYPPRDGYLP